MAGSFAAHVVVSKPVQFRVDERGELIERRFVPFAPGDEQPRNLLGRPWLHRNLAVGDIQIITIDPVRSSKVLAIRLNLRFAPGAAKFFSRPRYRLSQRIPP